MSGQSGECGLKRGWARVAISALTFCICVAPHSTESAIANGDTRTLSLTDQNTNESGTFTYMANGAYDMAVLEKLNWFMRDWRLNEQTKMDPKLFDILWEVYRQSGSAQPIDVLSGYRSPSTNAMLRRRSRQVAEHSQHMQGKAIDAHFVDVGTAKIRDITMRMQAGGVGFYPIGNTPWVHIDSGAVRYWPRMSREALSRLFPDGKTVFIPSDGQPMSGYELARAEIEARGGDVITAGSSSGGGLFAWLFGGPRGGGNDDAEESADSSVVVAGASGGNRGHSAGADTSAVAFVETKPSAAPAQPAETAKPAEIADVDTETPAAPGSGVTLRGPIAAEFIAPLPPRKPQDVLALAYADAPLPPTRPVEFTLSPPMAKSADTAQSPIGATLVSYRPSDPPPPPRPPEFVTQPTSPTASQGNRDMILALLKRGQLPSVITRGLNGPPREALALSETGPAEPPERPALIAKAALLTAPLPPSRPGRLPSPRDRDVEESRTARTTPPVPAPRPKVLGANPFGALTVQAFGDDPQAAASAQSLRAKAIASAN